MKKLTSLFLATLIQTSFIQSVHAKEPKNVLVPLPSVEDFSKGMNGWGFGLGIGVEYEAAYEGSDEYGFEVDPAGGVHWRNDDDIFFWEGEALGWRGLRSDTWLFEASLGFDEGREESDSDDGHLDGLGEGDERVELILQARHALSNDWRYWLDARIITGNQGTLGLLGLGYRFGDQVDGSGHDIAFALVFNNSKYVNEDFGIDAQQSLSSGLDETDLDGGYRSFVINYNYRHFVDENWQLFGEIFFERYSNEIDKSPIARNNYEAEVGLGFIYVF